MQFPKRAALVLAPLVLSALVSPALAGTLAVKGDLQGSLDTPLTNPTTPPPTTGNQDMLVGHASGLGKVVLTYSTSNLVVGSSAPQGTFTLTIGNQPNSTAQPYSPDDVYGFVTVTQYQDGTRSVDLKVTGGDGKFLNATGNLTLFEQDTFRSQDTFTNTNNYAAMATLDGGFTVPG